MAPVADCEQPDKALLEREGPPIVIGPGGRKPPKPPMDVNLYATKKSVAQGMMDIALLTANASQLKYVLREGDSNRFYTLNIVCISLSIAIQVVVGCLLIVNGRYNINMTRQQPRAELMNNLTIIGVFLITVVNVFVSAFGTSH